MKYEYRKELKALWNLASLLQLYKKDYHLSGFINILFEVINF